MVETFFPQNMVYFRPVLVADLPKDVQAQVEGQDVIFAVHDADGQQIAFVTDRKIAWEFAKENDFEPVMVH